MSGEVVLLCMCCSLAAWRRSWSLALTLTSLALLCLCRALWLVPASRFDILVQAGAWPAVMIAGVAWEQQPRRVVLAAPFLLYGVGLALFGALLTPIWPAPLMWPQVAAGGVAAALVRPRISLPQAAALLLPLSSLVDAVTVFAGAPAPTRAVLGLATYAAVGGMLLAWRHPG